MCRKKTTPLTKINQTLRKIILEKDEEITALRELLKLKERRVDVLEETLKSKKADARRLRSELLTKTK